LTLYDATRRRTSHDLRQQLERQTRTFIEAIDEHLANSKRRELLSMIGDLVGLIEEMLKNERAELTKLLGQAVYMEARVEQRKRTGQEELPDGMHSEILQPRSYPFQ
jgi:hypothetical protein